MTHARQSRLWTFIIDNSMLLIAGTLAGILWANTAPTSHEYVKHAFHFAVNDIGMVFFFALATKEIVEATLPGGPLASPREAAVPLLAAVGGMAAPAALYVTQVALAGRPELMPGWAIPCATDIAFSYLAARLIFPKGHPAIPFLLLLAIADDALGLVLLAVFYPSGPVSLLAFAALMIPAIGVSLWMKRRRTKSFWPYVVFGGGLSWGALYLGGLHPALALVPILPFMPHEKRDLGLFDEREFALPYTMNRFEHWWRVPVQFVLFAFGLVNAGVGLDSIGQGSWMVLSSLVVGKPVGIVLFTWLSVVAGLRAPGGLSYLHTAVLGVVAGIGFTVSLFFATAAFPEGQTPAGILAEAKMGALMSFVAFPLAIAIGRIVGLRPNGNTREA
jgi:NhaA family Na+:H+ antiporter